MVAECGGFFANVEQQSECSSTRRPHMLSSLIALYSRKTNAAFSAADRQT